MAEEMAWLFIVMKLKIIFNFICQESALFFAMKGAHDFLQCKEEEKTGGQWGRFFFARLPPAAGKEPQANWLGRSLRPSVKSIRRVPLPLCRRKI